MNLTLERMGLGRKSTLGRLYEGNTSLCWTLEDARRRMKVAAETCIPEGTYVVTLRTEGGKHVDYLKAYPAMHRGMLWVRDIPGFEFVLIHRGNTPADTAGCLLVGSEPVMNLGEFSVMRSAPAYERLYAHVVDAAARKELSITIKTREPA
ncbi:MAG TPA: DUF5675 family protein [Phycisphaerae bacterium]|nr:DUF5675 family protein [Phycisphaerae bacterium]